ncbi:hypothetical protein HK096_003300 [Nowakowskiella sp. JEL0078]|nr:hypothetical protein HK096_003300 [Nowakowskiella sp. JEL0078]
MNFVIEINVCNPNWENKWRLLCHIETQGTLVRSMKISSKTIENVADKELDFLRVESCLARIPDVAPAYQIIEILGSETITLRKEIRQLETLKIFGSLSRQKIDKCLPGFGFLSNRRPSGGDVARVSPNLSLIQKLQTELAAKLTLLEKYEKIVDEKEKLQIELSQILDNTVSGLIGPKEDPLKIQKKNTLSSLNSSSYHLRDIHRFKTSAEKTYNSLCSGFECFQIHLSEQQTTEKNLAFIQQFNIHISTAESDFRKTLTMIKDIEKIDVSVAKNLKQIMEKVSSKRWIQSLESSSISAIKKSSSSFQSDFLNIQIILDEVDTLLDTQKRSHARLKSTFLKTSGKLDKLRISLFKKILKELHSRELNITLDIDDNSSKSDILSFSNRTISSTTLDEISSKSIGVATLREIVELGSQSMNNYQSFSSQLEAGVYPPELNIINNSPVVNGTLLTRHASIDIGALDSISTDTLLDPARSNFYLLRLQNSELRLSETPKPDEEKSNETTISDSEVSETSKGLYRGLSRRTQSQSNFVAKSNRPSNPDSNPLTSRTRSFSQSSPGIENRISEMKSSEFFVAQDFSGVLSNDNLVQKPSFGHERSLSVGSSKSGSIFSLDFESGSRPNSRNFIQTPPLQSVDELSRNLFRKI